MSDRGPRDTAENSPVQMQAVINLLLQDRTVRAISEELEIPRARILRWYREDEDFKQMLRETEYRVVESLRDAFVAEQQESMIDLLPKAHKALAEALTDDDVPRSVRVTAAAHVFRLSGYGSGKEVGSSGPRPVGDSEPMEAIVRRLDSVRPAAGD
ncbi:MAG TPA: hypothetical protein VFQ40_07450 [Actinomycetota bacterium]|nr:hypothetical protein [Actinomycetota bacterium]